MIGSHLRISLTAEAWKALSATALGAATASALLAVLHVAQGRGAICGASPALPHCWACYAAPMLMLLALAAWGRARPRCFADRRSDPGSRRAAS